MRTWPKFIYILILIFPSNTALTQSINGSCNAIGNGNSLCNLYVNQKLKFDEQNAEKLLSLLPEKKPIRMVAIGSPSEQAIANQYANFLKSKGFSFLPGIYIGMTNMMPEKQITINDVHDHYELIIAAGVF